MLGLYHGVNEISIFIHIEYLTSTFMLFLRLSDLKGSQVEQLLTSALVKSMVSWEPLERPPAKAVLSHPLFWSKAKIMAFFQVDFTSFTF